jgi:hypothetical protein
VVSGSPHDAHGDGAPCWVRRLCALLRTVQFDLAVRRLLVLARPSDLQIEPNLLVIGPYESE